MHYIQFLRRERDYEKQTYFNKFFALSFAHPAIADIFPENGLMQENTTYEQAANYDNMGVYEGEVTAHAEYNDVLYQITAGKYLPAGAEAQTNCNVQGSFCPGGQSFYYDADNPQGLTTCASATNGEYTNSDGTGFSADSCFRPCDGNVTIEHANGITGNDYYGNGFDTCEPIDCENGWTKTDVTLNLKTIIGTEENAIDYANIDDMGNIGGNNAEYITTYNLSDRNSFVIDFGNKGTVTGHGRCSSQEGTGKWNGAASPEDITKTKNISADFGTGSYCWCQLDGYITPNMERIKFPAKWTFFRSDELPEYCQNRCAFFCALSMSIGNGWDAEFRSAAFDAVEPLPSVCKPNIINIQWQDATNEDVELNNAGQCVYGGDIRTPKSAIEKEGKRFKGWRFVNQNPNQ